MFFERENLFLGKRRVLLVNEIVGISTVYQIGKKRGRDTGAADCGYTAEDIWVFDNNTRDWTFCLGHKFILV